MLRPKAIMERKQVLGIIGSILLLVGVITPIWSLRFSDHIVYMYLKSILNYRAFGEGDIVLASALVASILIFARQYRWMWIPIIASLWAMSIGYVRFSVRDISALAFYWGWLALLAGVVALIIAAVMKARRAPDLEQMSSDGEP